MQGAWAASHTKDTYLAAQYRRLIGRRGKRRALVAVAHSMLVSAYHMLKRHQAYHELGGAFFDDRKKDVLIDRYVAKLAKLGQRVSLEPIALAAA